MIYGGMEVVESELMVESGEPIKVVRTFKERFFSLPWRPLKKTRTHTPIVPMRSAYQIDKKIVMHPVVAAELRNEIKRRLNKTENHFMFGCQIVPSTKFGGIRHPEA